MPFWNKNSFFVENFKRITLLSSHWDRVCIQFASVEDTFCNAEKLAGVGEVRNLILPGTGRTAWDIPLINVARRGFPKAGLENICFHLLP